MTLPPRVHCGALLLAMSAMATVVGCSPSPAAPVDAAGGSAGNDAAAPLLDGAGPGDALPGTGGGAGGSGGAGGAPPDGAVASDDARDAAAPRDGSAAPDAIGPGRPGWTLVWADEFDTDGPPSAADWNFERGFVRN